MDNISNEDENNNIKELKEEIIKLKEKVRKLEDADKKIYESVLETNKNNTFWNKVIGIGTISSTILTFVGLIIK